MIGYRRWSYLLLIASLSCIVFATISPFKFVISAQLSGNFVLKEFHFSSSIKDYWRNILLFIPLGISLGAIITQKQQKPGIVLIICCLASAILSTTVELTQVFLPSRISNFTDIIYNTVGGTLGASLYSWRDEIMKFISAIFTCNPSKLNLKSLVIVIFSYCSMVILAIWVLLISVNLTNWDNDYYLAIGNEVTGDRPWNGSITSLYISDRSLNSSEVVQAFEHTHSYFSQLPSLVTAIVFQDNQESYQDPRDLKLHNPDLEWQTKSFLSEKKYGFNELQNKTNIDRKKHQNQTVSVNSKQWLKTKYPATSLIQKLKTTSEFTLSLIVGTNQINQTGPARIIALSQDIYSCNLMIGQEETNVSFRLRTPITGDNASQPEFIIPNIFIDQNLHQILITFAQNKLTFYIDRLNNQYSFEFKPATSFLAYLPWTITLWQLNLQNFNLLKYQLTLYGIIFIPLLLLIVILASYLKCQKSSKI